MYLCATLKQYIHDQLHTLLITCTSTRTLAHETSM